MQAYLGAADAPVAPDAAGPLVGAITDASPACASSRAGRSIPPRIATCATTRSAARSRGPIPASPALALMPMAMSLEILAEAAAALVPGRIVDGPARRPRAPLARLGGRPAHARGERAAARAGAGRRPTACASSCASSTTPAGPGPAVEGTVVLADAHPAAPPPLAAPLDGAAPGRWAPGGLYADEMFHGPAWQGVEAVDAVAAGGAAGAAARAPPRRAAGRHARDPPSCSTRSCSTPPGR